jgi:activator of HSP90 ATPase
MDQRLRNFECRHLEFARMPKNVVMAASFAAPPEKLFDMYLDARMHAEFTGAPVVIEPRAGSAFRAFDGMLSGTILHVEPKRLIVQTWRSKNWPNDAIDSVLVLTFWHEPDGARIELVHVNVDDEDFAGVSHGWEKYYWAPWRAYLAGCTTA